MGRLGFHTEAARSGLVRISVCFIEIVLMPRGLKRNFVLTRRKQRKNIRLPHEVLDMLVERENRFNGIVSFSVSMLFDR